MGILISCCKDSSTDVVTPDMEVRRQQQAQAAEKRLREQEGRGVKDPVRVKRMQQRQEDISRREDEARRQDNTGGGLKWQVN